MIKTGYAVWTGEFGAVVERDTVSCAHCGCVIFVKPNTLSTVYLMWVNGAWQEEAGAGCYMCDKPVCLSCCAKGTCTPLEKRFEQLEARART